MGRDDDSALIGSHDRGQSAVLGFLFLTLLLVTVFSLHQAIVVPQHNAKVEFQHAQQMEDQVRSLRSRISLVGATGGTQTMTTDLGVDYPPRALAINPVPPAGRLHTRTVGNASISVGGSPINLTAACGYGGTHIRTRAIAYDAEYNEYSRDPTLVYEHTALYRTTENGYQLLSEEQSLVTNHTITLIPVTSNYSRSTDGTVTVELVGGPRDQTTIAAGSNESVQVTLPSDLPTSKWETLLANQPLVTGVNRTDSQQISISLEAGHNYTTTCYAVGVNRAPPSEA